MSARTWLKQAFAVDPPGPAVPTLDQQVAVDWVCLQIAKRHLTTPGLVFLEMSRPLNWIGAQALHFFRPGVWALAAEPTYEAYRHFSEYLEQRGSTEYLAERVEHFEKELTRVEKAGGRVSEFIESHFVSLREQRRAAHKTSAAEQARADETDE